MVIHLRSVYFGGIPLPFLNPLAAAQRGNPWTKWRFPAGNVIQPTGIFTVSWLPEGSRGYFPSCPMAEFPSWASFPIHRNLPKIPKSQTSAPILGWGYYCLREPGSSTCLGTICEVRSPGPSPLGAGLRDGKGGECLQRIFAGYDSII